MVQDNYSGGNATVLTPFLSGITNTVAKQQQRIANQEAQEAKEKEAFQKDLLKMTGDLDGTGIRTADIPKFSKFKDKMTETYYLANKAESTAEKMRLTRELQNILQESKQFAFDSKQTAKDLGAVSDIFINPQYSGLYGQDKKQYFQNLLNKPSDEITLEDRQKGRYISPDTSYLNKTFDAIATDLQKNAPLSVKIGDRVKVGNQMNTVVNFEGQVPEQVYKNALIDTYNNDTKVRNQLNMVISDFNKSNPNSPITVEQYIDSQVAMAKQQNKLINKKSPSLKEDARPRQESGGSSKEDILGNFMQQSVEGLLKEDKDTLGRIRANLLPNKEVDYVQVKQGDKVRKGVRVKSPEEVTATTIIPAINETVFYDNPNAATRLNKLLGIATGEKVSGSKFGIMGGKTTGPLAEPIIRDKTGQSKEKTKTKGELD